MQIYEFKFTNKRHYIYLTKKQAQMYTTTVNASKNTNTKDNQGGRE